MKPRFIFIIFISFMLFHKTSYSSDIFKICSSITTPYVNGNLETGETTGGIDVEIMDSIFKNLNIEYKLDLMPWAKCDFNIREGLYDSALQVSKTSAEREKYLYFPENEVWVSNFVFFTNSDTKKIFKIKSYDDIKKNKLLVGIARNNSYNNDFWEAFPWENKSNEKYHPLLQVFFNHDSGLINLSQNKIQLYPLDKKMGLFTAKKLGLTNITFYDFILFKKIYYQVFAKKSKYSSSKYTNISEVRNAYDLEFKKLKSSKKFAQIFDKYLSDKSNK